MAAPKSSSLPGLRGDDQKLALVTGASGVLGLATARALIDDDYRVIMVDLDQQKLAGQAEALGSAAIPVALDISSNGCWNRFPWAASVSQKRWLMSSASWSLHFLVLSPGKLLTSTVGSIWTEGHPHKTVVPALNLWLP